MLKKKKKAHFIGIGGIGMSAIARLMARQGYVVSGSDSKESAIINRMRSEGIKCHVPHSAANVAGSDIVVRSSSIGEDNPELRLALKKGMAILHRSEMLAKLTEGSRSIAVTGAHGKTTTTALLALIFEKAKMRPCAAIGGEAVNFGSNAVYNDGYYFIFEADESDGSFLNFRPSRAVILNIDREHFDYFRNMRNSLMMHKRFMENVKRGGSVYYCAHDERLRRLAKTRKGRTVSFGTSGKPDFKASAIRQAGLSVYFRCSIYGRLMPGEVKVPLPGRHNVFNALAAIAVSYDEGISFDVIKDAIAGYMGTKRRFEIKKAEGGFMLVEDYAHHPAEIRAVLEACKPLGKNIIAVFQPHRYTRTKDLFAEFAKCFSPAGRIIMTDIYPAGEKAIKGVTSKKLYEQMKRNGSKNVEYMEKSGVAGRVKALAGENDIVLLLGAGDINDIADRL